MSLNKQTLCWDCKRAINGCNWSRNGKPVEGWTAESTKLKCKDEYVESFHVIACPEFVQDRTK